MKKQNGYALMDNCILDSNKEVNSIGLHFTVLCFIWIIVFGL